MHNTSCAWCSHSSTLYASVDMCVHRCICVRALLSQSQFFSPEVLLRCGDGMASSVSLYSCANQKYLQGEEAKNMPGESMTEEHYVDRDGNLISRKVMYNFTSISHPDEIQPTTGRVDHFSLPIEDQIFFFLPPSSSSR